MNASLIRKTNLFGAWCGFAYCALLFFGWWGLGGFLPLHRPSAGAEEIASFFPHDMMSLRLGMVMWGAAVYIPFAASVADCIARVEGREGPLTRIALMAGYANAMLTFYPPLWWIAASWRADARSADMLYLLNDIAWLQFVGGLALVMPMYIVVAVTALADKSNKSVFPRWSAYLSIMAFLLLLPDQMLFFFKTGPFAWNGLFGFWVPAVMLSGWIIMASWLVRRAALAEPARSVEPAALATSG